LLLWQPDGRAAAVVSSTSLDVLNVETGAEIFHAALAEGASTAHGMVDGVWVQVSAVAAAASDGLSSARCEQENLFTDFLPQIPHFSEGGGDSNCEDGEHSTEEAAVDLAAQSSASSAARPSLSLIALLDVRGRSR
jgi:hypothetical protein